MHCTYASENERQHARGLTVALSLARQDLGEPVKAASVQYDAYMHDKLASRECMRACEMGRWHLHKRKIACEAYALMHPMLADIKGNSIKSQAEHEPQTAWCGFWGWQWLRRYLLQQRVDVVEDARHQVVVERTGAYGLKHLPQVRNMLCVSRLPTQPSTSTLAEVQPPGARAAHRKLGGVKTPHFASAGGQVRKQTQSLGRMRVLSNCWHVPSTSQ